MAQKTLTIVCPAYNEEAVIADFHAELERALARLADRYLCDILFVVDRSSDGTLAALKRIAAASSNVRVLALSARFGHQMSLLAGIDHCDADAVIMMDTDLQHPPGLIPELLAKFEEGFDIVRTVRIDSGDVGPLRRAAAAVFYRLLNGISDVPMERNAADFRLVSRRVIAVFQRDIRERTLFLRGLFGWVGFRTASVEFQADERREGRSKYSFGRLLGLATGGILAFSKKPLQAAIYVGLLFAAFALLLAAATFVQYFVHARLPPGWATLAILIPLFSGIQLVFLGVLGEYVGAIFDEVKGRPHYIVEEIVNPAPRRGP